MMRIELDYQRNARAFPPLGMALALFGVLAMLLAGGYYLRLEQHLSGWQASLEKLQHHSRQLVEKLNPQHEGSADDMAQAGEVVRQLSLPWDQMFRAVEHAVDKDVTLLGMTPDISLRQVQISGEARNPEAMLGFVARLQQEPVFGSVQLQTHQVNQEDAQQPYGFSLLAQWRATP